MQKYLQNSVRVKDSRKSSQLSGVTLSLHSSIALKLYTNYSFRHYLICLVESYLYLGDALNTRDCHGEAGELENKRPQDKQHSGGQGGFGPCLDLLASAEVSVSLVPGKQTICLLI